MNQPERNDSDFDMTAHISVDAGSGLIHHITGINANISDIVETHH